MQQIANNLLELCYNMSLHSWWFCQEWNHLYLNYLVHVYLGYSEFVSYVPIHLVCWYIFLLSAKMNWHNLCNMHNILLVSYFLKYWIVILQFYHHFSSLIFQCPKIGSLKQYLKRYFWNIHPGMNDIFYIDPDFVQSYWRRLI